MRLLLVEDDLELADGLMSTLEQSSYAVDVVHRGHEALAACDAATYQLVILDLGLPDLDGVEVLRRLRRSGATMPVLILTARDDLEQRVLGLDSGGDDYLSKPFAFAELVARIWALLRRSATDLTIRSGELRLDPLAHAVFCGEQRVALTPTEYRLLAPLLSHPGETVRRSELVRAAWPHGARVRDNTLDAYIARLRRKLRPLAGSPEIETVHGVGYCMH